MSDLRPRIKSGKASLVGGIVVGFACFVLWAGLAHQMGADTLPWLAVGATVAVGVAAWIRVADL